ncbi:MAG: AMP-binding protein, partial [Cyanobacteria bacterium J06641_5]
RTDDAIGTPSQFLRACQEWGVTILNLPTAFWHQLVASAQVRFPPAVRLVIIGGERALPNMVKTWQQQVGDYPRLINAYGPTEATVTATTFSIDRSATIRQEVPIGRPLANTETYILDRHCQPVPIGVPGELHIGGKSLARGYWNRPDLTQLRFVPNPFSREANARLYKTGDRARYLPDGNIEFLGRLDNQVKIRGFRIELGEIEAVLSQYPGVRETSVIASEETPGNAQLVAYIIEAPEQPVSLTELRSFLQKHLPNYMVPAAIVPLEALPLTPNGKVDLKALPKPAPLTVTEEAAYVAPRTPLEDTLAAIWAETLDLPKVGVRDSFFELGGHSLQAIRVMARIEGDLGVELPLSALFQAPTVAAMARQLAQAGAKSQWTPLVPLQTTGSKRPFFAIHGGHGEVLFYQALAEHLGEGQPFYALRALGNDYPEMAHRRVEEMATCYIEAIRRVQPEGPYSIGGTSLGGIIAFEIARQLHSLGQVTEALIMFDTGGVDDVVSPLPLWQRVINACRYIPKYGIAETWNRVLIRILKLFNTDSAVEFYRATGELPKQTSDVIKVWEAVWDANLEAIDRYQPRPYAGKVVLLSAKDDGDSMWNRQSQDCGWGGYVEGGLEAYDLPGTHIGMFQEPHVKQLAKVLEQILERAE